MEFEMTATGSRSAAVLLTGLLNAGWYFVAFALALIVVIAAMSPYIDFRQAQLDIPVSFSVDTRILPVTATAPGVQNAQIHGVHGSLKFEPTDRRALIAPLVFVMIMLAVALWALAQLRAIFRTIRDGRPFVPANAKRIRTIAFIVIFGELARSALVFVANRYAMTHFAAEGLQFDARLDLNAFTIVQGVIILVIGEVFRAGSRLDEDQSLTI
jgi:hypothetical protein